MKKLSAFLCMLVFVLGQVGITNAAGQTQPSDLLQFTAAGHVLGFETKGVYVASANHMLRVEFAGTQGVKPVADQMQSGDGKAQPLGRVTYADLWPGISLSYDHVGGGIVESTYVVNPGADVSWIQLRYNAPVEIEANGSLLITYETGQMRESAPVAWQDINGRRISVEVAFCLPDSPTRNSVVGFALGHYNPAYPLTIDPTLQWNTFMGGSGTLDYAGAIAVDSSGNVYVTGRGGSWGSPVNAHAGGNAFDAFAAKLNTNGIRLWNTFMGSTSADAGHGIAVDGSGNVYVTGRSEATWGGSPVNAHAGSDDAFVAKLDSTGTRLWNTFMGSSSIDYGEGIVVDASGNVYVTGHSNATWGFPINAYVASGDAFAAKLDSSGTRQWHTFMGGPHGDNGYGIALDSSGNIYVAGHSNATWGSPVNAHSGGTNLDAFAAKLNNSGTLLWNTFMGSTGFDYGYGITVDVNSNVYVSGYSYATWGTPVNPHTAGSNRDTFAAKLDSSGTRQWNTFMGSTTEDYGFAIAADANGNVYVAGYSDATWGTPVNPYVDRNDAFAAMLNSNGTRQWNTFMGAQWDEGRAIAVDGSGYVYVAGDSDKSWGSPVDPHGVVGYDAFVAKLDSSITSTIPTVSEWGMIIFFILLVGLGFWVIRRRKSQVSA